MHILDILDLESEEYKPSFSFEFFPPKTTEAGNELFEHIEQLNSLSPSFVSITYGAGGAQRHRTQALVERMKAAGIPTVPHLTCVGHKEQEITEILDSYAELGVSNILALRGDTPTWYDDPGDKPGSGYMRSEDDFHHASDLVRFIRNYRGHSDSRGFGIGVAGFPEGHPETPNRLKEMEYLKAKVDAGADYIVTQMFFDNHDFHDFRERCDLAGISVPILAGIMPVTSIKGMTRMAELAAGAHIPAELLRDLEKRRDDSKAIRAIGIHHAASQCRDLLRNEVDGIHFYTLNRSNATIQIYESLGL